jgi:hypothetical protein
MNRQPVASSNLSSVGYDADNQILEVAFHHGGIYQYYGVPVGVYRGLMAAPAPKVRTFTITSKIATAIGRWGRSGSQRVAHWAKWSG